MPLVHDPEWQLELDKLLANTMRAHRAGWWARLVIIAAVLGGVLWLLIESGASEGVMISAIVVAATLCIVATVNSAIDAVCAGLAILVGTVEWTGRKQLGEYEKPEA